MLPEVALIFVGTIVSIRLLYEGRGIPLIGRYLSSWAALLMLYPPILHTLFRKISLPLFEKNRPELLHSLKYFFTASLILFPLFLIGNHLYQTFFFGRELHWGSLPMLPSLVTTQLLIIALPEEILFRGWLQTMLEKRFPASRALVMTAFLFAAAHSAITLRWWHFAIFFPGLVFGWLRQKTGHITASVLFHAASNLLSAWIGSLYL